MPLGLVFRELLIYFGDGIISWFLKFLIFLLCHFHIWNIITGYLQIVHFSLMLLISGFLGLLQIVLLYSLRSLCDRFLNLCILLFLEHKKLAVKNFLWIFQNLVLYLQFVSSPLPTDSDLIFWEHFDSPTALIGEL